MRHLLVIPLVLLLLAVSTTPPAFDLSQRTQTAPYADLKVSPENPDVGEEVIFDATGSQPASEGDTLEYKFSPGDGSPSSEWTSQPVWRHKYDKKGSYKATVQVRNQNGEVGEDSVIVEVGKEMYFTVFGLPLTTFILLVVITVFIIALLIITLRKRRRALHEVDVIEEQEDRAEEAEAKTVMAHCPNCGHIMEITYTHSPVILTCENCGMRGELPLEELEDEVIAREEAV